MQDFHKSSPPPNQTALVADALNELAANILDSDGGLIENHEHFKHDPLADALMDDFDESDSQAKSTQTQPTIPAAPAVSQPVVTDTTAALIAAVLQMTQTMATT